MTSLGPVPYFSAGTPFREPTVLEMEEHPTVVGVGIGLPVERITDLFAETFAALVPVLAERGIRHTGPAFSLHRRLPTDTVDVEVGHPVDRPLPGPVTCDDGFTLEPSTLPSGRIAVLSHLGGHEGLPEAWGRFLSAVARLGHHPAPPLWEVYVSGPERGSGGRTDLAVLLG